MNFSFFENEASDWKNYHDEYGLLNYQFLVNELSGIVRAAKAAETPEDATPLTLALINMDYFKTINSALGNAGGDVLLIVVADRILSVLRERGKSGVSWKLCRTRADEFALLIEEECDNLLGVLEAIRDAIYEPCDILCAGEEKPRTVYPSASIGVLPRAQHQESAARALEMASEALNASKEIGLGKILFYSDEMEQEEIGEGSIDLAKVLSRRYEICEGLAADARVRPPESGQFIPYFQPIHYCRDRDLAGFETLVRWNHPSPGEHPRGDPSIPLSPGDFIDYAKRAGIAGEIDQLMMRKALDFMRQYPEYSFYFSVNATPDLLEREDMDELRGHPAVRMLEDLKRGGIDTSRFALEVLEDSLDEKKINKVISALEALKGEYGIRVFLDDFGTGYSSLGRIPTLPIDCIKLDKSFIDKAVPDPARPPRGSVDQEQSRKLLQAIINMANDLGKDSIAEGVETEEQFAWLKDAGCRKIQGYIFHKPMPQDEAAAYIREKPWSKGNS